MIRGPKSFSADGRDSGMDGRKDEFDAARGSSMSTPMLFDTSMVVFGYGDANMIKPHDGAQSCGVASTQNAKTRCPRKLGLSIPYTYNYKIALQL